MKIKKVFFIKLEDKWSTHDQVESLLREEDWTQVCCIRLRWIMSKWKAIGTY